MRTIWGPLFLALLAPLPLWAASITGTVTALGNDQRLTDVFITLEGEGMTRTAISDQAGYYEFKELGTGVYNLEFVATEYQKQTLKAELLTDEDLKLNAVLTPDDDSVEEILVLGSASEAQSRLQTGFVNLDNQTLSKIPSVIEPDPLRALQVLPGVQAASDISSGLYIRGGGPDQNLVLMDGVTVYNPTHAFGFFSTFNNDVVDDVDLYKGAYPAEYGGRLGAVLDVAMKKPEAREFSGKAGISLIAARAFMEGSAGPDSWQMSARRSYLDPILSAIRTEENPIPAYYFYDLNAAYATRRWGGRTTVQVYHGKDDIGIEAEANTNADLDWGNTVVALRHERALSDHVDGRLVLSNSRYRSSTDAEFLATRFNVDNRLNDFTVATVLDWYASYEHSLHLGASYSWYDFSYTQGFNLSPSVEYESRPSEFATFLEDEWYPSEATALRGGVRYRYLSDGQRSLVEPRLSVSHSLNPSLRLKLGGGLYNQYLQLVATEGFSAGDFYLPIDESAEMGRSWQLVVGADWDPTERDQISLETYTTDLQNLLEFDDKVSADQNIETADQLFVTDGKGYARGIELFWRHQGDAWTGWLGYTLGWSKRTFDELNGGSPFPPKYDRRHDINALVSKPWGSWKLAASFRYATGQAFTPAAARYQLEDPAIGDPNDASLVLSAARNSGRLLPYHRLDVSARRPISLFGKPMELVLEVFNLYNWRNEWYVQYDTDEDVTEATVVRQLPLIPSVGVNFDF